MCDYTLYDWERAVFLLSLDKTSAFVPELGIESFYSESVRDAARDCIRAGMESEDTSESAMMHRFIRKLKERCGDSDVCKFQVWQNEVLEGLGEYNIYWSWIIVLSRLSRLWDATALSRELPLSDPGDTGFRIRVRDYLRHIDDIRLESELVERSIRSNWDDEVMQRSGEFGFWETLVETCHSRYSRRFWSDLIEDLSADKVDKLLRWAHAFAEVEDLPVEHVSIPINYQRQSQPVTAA